MKLLTDELKRKLTKAGHANMKPLCKMFTPWGSATWLITGIQDGILYGFADIGQGCVEWGGIAIIEEFEAIRGPFGLSVERDLHWTPPDKEVNYFQMQSLVKC